MIFTRLHLPVLLGTLSLLPGCCCQLTQRGTPNLPVPKISAENKGAPAQEVLPQVPPPTGPLLYQPMLVWGDGEASHQGTGFLAATPEGDTVGVTSAHFVNFAGPPLKQVAWLEIPGDEPAVTFTRSLGPPGKAGSMRPLDLRSDYMIFVPDELLADDRPALELDNGSQKTERVWLPNKSWDDEAGYELIEGDLVTALSEYLVIRLDKRIQLQSQSGSPIISQQTGKVIGTLASANVDNEGYGDTIYLAPATAILQAMKQAKEKPLLSDVVGSE